MPLYRGTAKRALIIPNRAPPPTIDAIGADLALWFDRNEGYKSSGGGIVSATSLLTVARASNAYYFDSSGVMQLAANDTLRLDHDPFTGVPLGILNEEGRTNFCTRSNDFGDAAWGTKTNVTISAAAAVGPDGTMSASKIEATTSGTTNLSTTWFGAGSANGNTYSIFVKKGNTASAANSFTLRNDTTSTNLVGAALNFDTGVITGGLSAGASVKQLSNGWWRISLSSATGISAGDNIRIYIGWSGGAGVAGDFLYVYGAQVEAGAFATSYIPTAGSTVTRAADLISMATSGFTFNALTGTMKLEARAYALPTPSSSTPMWCLRPAADVLTRIEQYVRHTTGIFRLFVRTAAGGGQVDLNDAYASAAIPGVPFKTVAAWEQDNYAISANGAPVTTDLAGTLPNGLDTLYLGNGGPSGAGIAPVHIRRLEYYSSRKTNGELPTMSAA